MRTLPLSIAAFSLCASALLVQSCWTTTSCFSAGTLIMSPAGPVPIEQIQPGQVVYSYDEARGEVVPGIVERVMVHPDRPYQRLPLPDGERLGVTDNHPIFAAGKGRYLAAGTLAPTEQVLYLAGRSGDRPEILRGALRGPLAPSEERGTVYDLTVTPHHNFFAAGLLVHNKSPNYEPDDLSGRDAEDAEDAALAADAALADAGAGAVGAPCTSDGQCATGQCLTEAQDPIYVGGYCTIKGCSDARVPCPTGSECRGSSLGVAICLQSCLGMTDICRKGHRCCGPGPAPRWCAPEQSQVCRLR